MDSRKNLPYIDHILKEVLRWHPATPTGVPHMTTEQSEYRGEHSNHTRSEILALTQHHQDTLSQR